MAVGVGKVRGLHDFPLAESVAPYIEAVQVVADTDYRACRAVFSKTAAAHVLTVN